MVHTSGGKAGPIPLEINDKQPPIVGCYTPVVGREGEITDANKYFRTKSQKTPPSDLCEQMSSDDYHFDTIRFTIDKADTFNFFIDGSADPNIAVFVALNKDNFDSANPCDDFISDTYAGEDPDMAGATPILGGDIEFKEYLDNVGGDYFLVMTTSYTNKTGKYRVTIEGKDGGRALEKVKDCKYDALFCFEDIDEKVVILGDDNCDKLADNVTLTNEVITENKDCKTWKKDTLAEIVREYVVTDESGNVSAPKTITVYVKSISKELLNTIKIPENFKCSDKKAISCSADYPKDAEGHPSPEHCGWPILKYKGKEIVLNNKCNGCLSLSYNDVETNNRCEVCTKSIMRTWTIFATTCSGDTLKVIPQTIDIADKTAPEVTCPKDQVVTMNFGDKANFELPDPEALDNCHQENIEWRVSVRDSNNNAVYYVPDAYDNGYAILPGGKDSIIYTISDVCGNDTLCKFVVEVKDLTPPVAVCQTFTTVSIGEDGTGNLPAYALNSGSYDNCGTLKPFKVKRMGEPDSAFDDFVQFSCADMESSLSHMVVLQVEDPKGNKATCMVTAELQDKLPPSIICPANMEVECDHVYADNELDKYFGEATVTDNCVSSLDISTKVKSENFKCYDPITKRIIRKFYVSQSGEVKDSCTQTISFKHGPYFATHIDGTKFSDKEVVEKGLIEWPKDTTIVGCLPLSYESDPSSPLNVINSGVPKIQKGACDAIGFTYSDEKYTDNGSATVAGKFCFKVIRTWTVLDDCHRIGGKFAKWEYEQVLFVNNFKAPEIKDMNDTVKFEFFLPDCNPGTKAEIKLKYAFEDDCTAKENLRWKYFIDYDNDNVAGTWDFESTTGAEDTMRFIDSLTVGEHKILWQGWDQCGNSTSKEQIVKIVNKILPDFSCIKPKVVLGEDANAKTKAGVGINCCCTEHPCGYPLVFSFSSDTTNKTKDYDCSYIHTYGVGTDPKINIGYDTVQIWVSAEMPDGTLVQDFCVTRIEIQDNKNKCAPSPLQPIVSGIITNIKQHPIEGVEIELVGSEQASQVTNSEGKYEFSPLNQGGSYTVRPKTGDDYMNGLSTIDLVLIQKHILAIDKIDSPYLILASDANNDNRVTAADILILRKLILGITEELPGKQSWKYVSKDIEFDNKNHPFNSYEGNEFEINSISGDVSVDYYGVKIGDINMSASSDVESRSANDLILSVDDRDFAANEQVRVDFYAKDFNGIQGFQGTFNFDNSAIQFVSVESGVLDVNNSNIAVNRLAEGQIPFSWFKPNAIEVKDDAILFSVNFKALAQGSVKSAISLNSSVTKLEAYDSQSENMDMTLQYRNDVSGFELLQNIPNPFSNNTEIRFSIDEESEYTLTVYDVSGRVVYEKSAISQKGVNSVSITRLDIDATGVLYYTVSTDKYSATRKMIVLK